MSIDVRDPGHVARVSQGATAIYNCVNPLYFEWPEKLLPIARGIADGSRRAGARLVVLSNLYMYGDNAWMNEASPEVPVSRKGRLRKEADTIMRDAGAAIGRAADFFGPEAPLSILGEHFWSRVMAGKSAQVFGDPDQRHTYSYTPDVARGLVALGESAGNDGVWMLPVQPAESTRAVIGRAAAELGRPIPISVVPTWLLRAVGVFSPNLREMAEMTYQWKQPYVVDDQRFRARFGLGPTEWTTAMRETVRWGAANWGKASGTSRAAQLQT